MIWIFVRTEYINDRVKKNKKTQMNKTWRKWILVISHVLQIRWTTIWLPILLVEFICEKAFCWFIEMNQWNAFLPFVAIYIYIYMSIEWKKKLKRNRDVCYMSFVICYCVSCIRYILRFWLFYLIESVIFSLESTWNRSAVV